MNHTPIWFYLYLYVPLLLLLIFSGYFYIRAIKHPGLEKLKKFTSVLLGVIAAIVILAFLKYDMFHFLEYIPFSFWGVIDNSYIRLTLVFGLTIYFIISTKVIWHEQATGYLQIAWLLIFVFNIASITWYAYKYFTWQPRVINPTPDPSFIANLLHDHFGPGIYARNMIVPFIWNIVSCISLLKIRKENDASATLPPSS
jgi:hypothetical protein